MSSPATAARAVIKTHIANVFTAESWTAGDDKFGRSKGMDLEEDDAAISVTTDFERPRQGREELLDIGITVQFYLGYDASPDETISRDSTVIEELASRMRDAFQGVGARVDSGDAWYLRIIATEYPDDPTGNKTRFEMHFICEAYNRAAMPS